MGFVGSDLWKVRQKWGRGPLVWPGVTVLVLNERDEVWVGLRGDTKNWSIVGGFFELGDDAAGCARREIGEELGAEVVELQMIEILTSVAATTVRYPNGDEAQSPSFVFWARVKADDVRGDDEHDRFEWVSFEEAERRCTHGFGYSSFAFGAYKSWKKTGEFQVS